MKQTAPSTARVRGCATRAHAPRDGRRVPGRRDLFSRFRAAARLEPLLRQLDATAPTRGVCATREDERKARKLQCLVAVAPVPEARRAPANRGVRLWRRRRAFSRFLAPAPAVASCEGLAPARLNAGAKPREASAPRRCRPVTTKVGVLAMAEGGERTRQEGFGEGEGGSKGGAELRTRRRGNRRSRTGEGEPVNIHDGGTILKICRGIYVNI